MVNYIVYSTASCPYCERAKELLQSKGLDYEEIRVDTNETALKEMMEKSGNRTVPQIFIDGNPIGGFDQLKQLNDEGKL